MRDPRGSALLTVTPERRAWAVALVALAVALASCAHAPMTPVVRAPRPLDGRGPRAAARAASAAETALASAPLERSGSPVAEIDPGPYLGRPLKRGPAGTHRVAITMDDGPSKNTEAVLAIFQRMGVRCTFFYVGNRIPRYRILAHTAYESGFEIGSHTWQHLEIKGASLQADLGEIDRGAAAVEAVTGHRPVFMRPPAGHYDETGLRAVTESGIVMALWSLHGHDTGPGTHADVIARGVVAGARGGDVILLHETNPETVKALPAIIEGLRRKGLEPVTLSALLER